MRIEVLIEVIGKVPRILKVDEAKTGAIIMASEFKGKGFIIMDSEKLKPFLLGLGIDISRIIEFENSIPDEE